MGQSLLQIGANITNLGWLHYAVGQALLLSGAVLRCYKVGKELLQSGAGKLLQSGVGITK